MINEKYLRNAIKYQKRLGKAGAIDGLSFNDNWNIANFGTDRATWALVASTMTHLYGLFTGKVTAKQVKQFIEKGYL